MVNARLEYESQAHREAAGLPPEHSPTIRVYLAIARCVAALPLPIRSVIGWCLGYIVGLLPIRERRFALLQVRAFLPTVSASRLVPRVFGNAGRTLLESLRLQPALTAERRNRIVCPAWSSILSWTNDARPIVALTAHTGNWDLLAAFMIRNGIPITTVGREARHPGAQAILRSMREGYGIETIWRSDRAGLKRLMNCLKERRVVAALIDQDTRVESIMVPFFGTPVKTPVSLVSLGMKYHARFVSAFLVRTGFLRFEARVEEFPDGLSESELLTEYHQRLEAVVRAYPDQWVWFHKRWRTMPEGETLSSQQYEAFLQARIANRVGDV